MYFSSSYENSLRGRKVRMRLLYIMIGRLMIFQIGLIDIEYVQNEEDVNFNYIFYRLDYIRVLYFVL